MKWRHKLGLVAIPAALIVATLFLSLRTGTERPMVDPKDLRMLTIEETVGIAFYAGTPPCVVRRANPQARDTLFEILRDPSLAAFHLQAANVIGYVCQSSDISEIESEIARRALMPKTASNVQVKLDGLALCMALAIMDHRKLEGAAATLRRMTSEGYWDDLGVEPLYAGGGKPSATTVADDYRIHAIIAYGWTERPDVQDVATAAFAGTTGNRRLVLEGSVLPALKDARDAQGFFSKACDEETHEKWVSGLQACWNNDIDNPLPTANRRFAAED